MTNGDFRFHNNDNRQGSGRPCATYGKYHGDRKCLANTDAFFTCGKKGHKARDCNGYHQKDKIQAKPDKTEHEMESMEKSKVNQSQQKVKDRAEGGPIAPIAIQARNFGLKNDMIQQVQNSCQFHGLLGDDANKHLDKFLRVTQSIIVNGVIDDALHLYLFPHSLTRHATAWFDRLLRNSINTFEQIEKMFLGKYFPPSMVTKLRNKITNFCQHTFYNGLTLRHRDTINAAAGRTFMKRRPKECYDLIENMTAHHNDWDTSAQRSESSSSITSSSDLEIVALKAKMAKINKNLMKVLQNFQNQNRNQGNNHPQGNNQERNQFFQGASHGQNLLPAYQVPAYQSSGYQALVHQPLICQPQVVTTTEFTNYMKANDAILKNMQTNMTSLTNSNLDLKNMFGQFMKMNTASSSGSRTFPSNTITNSKEDLKGITTRSRTAYQEPTIPTTSSSLPKVLERETEVTNETWCLLLITKAPKTSNLWLSKLKIQYQILSPLLLPLKKVQEKYKIGSKPEKNRKRFGDLQWGNILITRVYFIEGLGHNLFSVGQFSDSDLEVAFRKNACFVRNLEGVDLLKGDRSTNLYTINLHEMTLISAKLYMFKTLKY
nr:hypothetical protein [Tanacetum cinerariifolium]